MSLSNKIYEGKTYLKELNVLEVKEALQNYIKDKAELFKLHRKFKINLNMLRIKMIELERKHFGEELLEEKSFEEQEKEITKRFKKGMNINVEEIK